MIKNRIEKITEKEKIKNLQNDFLKFKNPFATKIIFRNDDFIVVDLSKAIEKNDIIIFQEGMKFKKAVVTAKGKDGVTARDKKNEKIKIRYSSILNWKKR